MKTRTYIYILFILSVFSSCKKIDNIDKVNNEKNTVKSFDSVYKIKAQNDIYINNEFNGMTELVDVIAIEFKETSIDSIWYGFYNIRDTEAYIFSVNKFLENPDVEQYRTIDTVNLKSKNIEVKVENFSDYKTLNLLLDTKLIKKWKFKTYPKATKVLSTLNNWQKDNIEIYINKDNMSYLFHGQCVYTFPIKIVNDNVVELVWGEIGTDCVYEVFFDEIFDLPKDKTPQKGKPFSKYVVDNEDLKVTYYYEEWVERYKKKITKEGKPFPFLKSFSLKTE
ncbi:hypothetical protein [Flavobacterium covae]|uniref:hypothetical protein n=1 Tax=Flavobacterium covae TaxID=2906076 RepID=UPI0035E4219C